MLRESRMHASWVWFFAWWKDVCVTVMAAIGYGERSRLQLPPCFLSLFLSSSSLLTQHHKRSAYSKSISFFFLGKGKGFTTYSWLVLPWERGRRLAAAGRPFREEESSPSLLFSFIPPLKWERCVWVLDLWFLSLFWAILDWFLFQFSLRIG